MTKGVHISDDVQFKTPLGRRIFTAVFQPPRRNVAQKFQRHRMAFAYELDEEEDALDIPTTLHRSKADCPKVISTPHPTPPQPWDHLVISPAQPSPGIIWYTHLTCFSTHLTAVLQIWCQQRKIS